MNLALNRKALWVLVALLPSYSYCDSIAPYYGQTGNAASGGNAWNMDNVFPTGIPGLDVQNVIYSYTIHKEMQDRVDVSVQNENALGSGYIFRETDSWMPGSLDGTQINKAVPVIPNIPREAWGDGSIEVDGPGSVSDASVIYTYKVDPCYDAQFDPNCPGYEPPLDLVPVFEYEPYDATVSDSDISKFEDEADYEEEEELSDEEKAEKEAEEERDREERLEKALAAADNAALFADALAMSQMLDTLNMATNMNSYYGTTIPGGVYKDTVQLYDSQLPENRQGLRNGLAQQILHEKMIDMQYDR